MNDQTDTRVLGDLQRLSLQPDDHLILIHPGHISMDTAARIKATFELHLNGRKCFVVGDGMQVAAMGPDHRLDRIEAKLDKLLAALAEEEEEEQPARSLDGDELPSDRDQGQPL